MKKNINTINIEELKTLAILLIIINDYIMSIKRLLQLK